MLYVKTAKKNKIVTWSCQIVFILFYEESWTGEVSNVIKNDHFLVFLAVWVFFHKFLGMLRSGLC